VPDLFLIRHAKSDYPPGIPDHDRPLSARGRQDAAVAATWLEQCGLVTGPWLAVVSDARRTRDTWAILGTALSDSHVSVRPDLYEAGVGTVLSIITQAWVGVESLFIVGHNPTIHATALHLAGISASGSIIAERFPTCAIAVLRARDDEMSLVHVEVPRARTAH
jgi:phosphohistidine phosphatase